MKNWKIENFTNGIFKESKLKKMKKKTKFKKIKNWRTKKKENCNWKFKKLEIQKIEN